MRGREDLIKFKFTAVCFVESSWTLEFAVANECGWNTASVGALKFVNTAFATISWKKIVKKYKKRKKGRKEGIKEISKKLKRKKELIKHEKKKERGKGVTDK